MTVAELMTALASAVLIDELKHVRACAAVGDSLRVELVSGEQYTLRVTAGRNPNVGRCTVCNRLLNEKEKDSESKMCNRCEHGQGK